MKYCYYCGKLLEIIDSTNFDTQTGELLKIGKCFNKDCREGESNICVKNGGHDFSFWSGQCKKCGYGLGLQ